jgi:hypothetical protein
MIKLKMNWNTLVLIAIIIILVISAILIWSILELGTYIFSAIAAILAVLCYFQSVKQSEPNTSDSKIIDTGEPEIEQYVPEVEKPKAALSELPIETIEGIGKTYGEELRAAGINTVEDLLAADPENIGNICDVSIEVAEKWIAMGRFTWLDTVSEEDAEAIVAVSAIQTLEDLSQSDTIELLEKIKAAVASGHVRVPANYKFTLEMVQSWINEAKGLI